MAITVVEVPSSNRHPAEESVVPLSGKPVDVHVIPKGSTAPAAPVTNSLLRDLQGKAGAGSASAKAVVVEGSGQTVGEGGLEAREPPGHRRARRIALPWERVEVHWGPITRGPGATIDCVHLSTRSTTSNASRDGQEWRWTSGLEVAVNLVLRSQKAIALSTTRTPCMKRKYPLWAQ